MHKSSRHLTSDALVSCFLSVLERGLSEEDESADRVAVRSSPEFATILDFFQVPLASRQQLLTGTACWQSAAAAFSRVHVLGLVISCGWARLHCRGQASCFALGQLLSVSHCALTLPSTFTRRFSTACWA